MPIVDLTGKRIERQAQILQMMNQMRNQDEKQSSAMDQFNREYELKLQEERRLQAESNARKGNIQSEIDTRTKTQDLNTWQAGEKSVLDWGKDTRAAKHLEEGQLPLERAQRTEAEARTGLTREQTTTEGVRRGSLQADIDAKKNKLKEDQNNALSKHTNDQWNVGVQYLQSGNPNALTKDNVDQLEKTGKLKFGPAFALPRNEDGSLDQAKAGNFLMTMSGKDNLPSADFAKDVHGAEKPYTPFEADLQSWQEAITKGETEKAKWYSSKLWAAVQPTVGKVQGAVLKQMFDNGEIDGIKQTLPGWRVKGGLAAAKAAGLPPAEARQRTEDGINTLGQINRLEQQFSALNKSLPMPATGRIVTPMWDFWAALQMSNPDVQAFKANLKDVVAQYRKFITGKASNVKEMADLLQAVPNENDDTKAFTKKLAEMRWKTTRRVRTDLGMQLAYGLKIPVEIEQLGPDFEPIRPTDAIKKWGAPDLYTDSGQKMWRAGELDKGYGAVAGQARRAGQQIAGPNEVRNKGAQLGQSIDPDAFQQYYKGLDQESKTVFEEMSPDDQVRAMQGTLK